MLHPRCLTGFRNATVDYSQYSAIAHTWSLSKVKALVKARLYLLKFKENKVKAIFSQTLNVTRQILLFSMQKIFCWRKVSRVTLIKSFRGLKVSSPTQKFVTFTRQSVLTKKALNLQ